MYSLTNALQKLKKSFAFKKKINNICHIEEDILIVDDEVPQPQPYAFRNAEFTGLAERMKNLMIATYNPEIITGFPFEHSIPAGRSYEQFLQDRKSFLTHYPNLETRVKFLSSKSIIKCKFAYTVFLNQTYSLLPFFEKNNIPFIFELYPGGGFELHNAISDHKLKAIFNSPLFLGVITTQPISTNYIKKSVQPECLFEILGGFPSIPQNATKERKYYGYDKQTLDVSFVAVNYAFNGLGKGYDLVLDSARQLCSVYDNIHFHIVGNWDAQDIVDMPELHGKVTYYGMQPKQFFPVFFQSIDISLNPTRPFCGGTAFDGFPLGLDAGICGVPLFVADDLNLNRSYASDEIEIIHPKTSDITKRISYYHKHPSALKSLALKCAVRSKDFCSLDRQLDGRIKIFLSLLKTTAISDLRPESNLD